MGQRLKVLLSAYACEPGKGSEPGVGWNWTKQIARYHDVWVITRANNKDPIEHALQTEPMPNVHWVYSDLPRWLRFWKKGQRGIQFYYYLWQIGAYFVGKPLHREFRFDLVHHLTFVKYWTPSFLSLLPVPFVWGPIGGGESSPKAFFECFSLRGKVYEILRNLARWLGERDPFVRLTAKRARLALATTLETGVRLKRLGCQNVKVLSQLGMTTDEMMMLSCAHFRNANPFRLVSVANLLHWKGFHLSLTAFARFQEVFPNCEYWLVGDGPERKNLELLADKCGVGSKIQFWGRLSREQVLKKLGECDALMHPSLHDSGGWVCLEAMAARLPVICLDLGGPALQVTDETGFKVGATTPEQVVNDLVQAMLRLARNSELRATMGAAGRKRVAEHFAWEKKGEWINANYRRLSSSCDL